MWRIATIVMIYRGDVVMWQVIFKNEWWVAGLNWATEQWDG